MTSTKNIQSQNEKTQQNTNTSYISVISAISENVYTKNNIMEWPMLFQTIIKGTSKDTLKALRKGEDPNFKLHCGETPLFQAVELEKIDHTKVLLDNGADVNITNNEGYSVLHIAVTKRNHELVTLILKKNADPNIKIRYLKRTTLHLCIIQRSTPEILYTLMHYGALQSIKDAKNMTAFDYLTDDMVELRKAVDIIKKDLNRSKLSINTGFNIEKEKVVNVKTDQNLFCIGNQLGNTTTNKENIMNIVNIPGSIYGNIDSSVYQSGWNVGGNANFANTINTVNTVNTVNSNNLDTSLLGIPYLNTVQTQASNNKNELSNINLLNIINNKEVSYVNENDTFNSELLSPKERKERVSLKTLHGQGHGQYNIFNNTTNTISLNMESQMDNYNEYHDQIDERSINTARNASDKKESPNQNIFLQLSQFGNTFSTVNDGNTPNTPIESKRFSSKYSSNQYSYTKTSQNINGSSSNEKEIDNLSVFCIEKEKEKEKENENHENEDLERALRQNDYKNLYSNINIKSHIEKNQVKNDDKDKSKRSKSVSSNEELQVKPNKAHHKYNNSDSNGTSSNPIMRNRLMYHKVIVKERNNSNFEVIPELKDSKETSFTRSNQNTVSKKSRKSKEKSQITVLNLTSGGEHTVPSVKSVYLNEISFVIDEKDKKKKKKKREMIKREPSEDSLNYINHDHADDNKQNQNIKNVSSVYVNKEKKEENKKKIRKVSTLENIIKDSNENIFVESISNEITYINDENCSGMTDNLEQMFNSTLKNHFEIGNSDRKLIFNTVGDLDKPLSSISNENEKKDRNYKFDLNKNIDEIYIDDTSSKSNMNENEKNDMYYEYNNINSSIDLKKKHKVNKSSKAKGRYVNDKEQVEDISQLSLSITKSNSIYKKLHLNKDHRHQSKSNEHLLTLELSEWLTEIDLQQYFSIFFKKGLFLENIYALYINKKLGLTELTRLGVIKPGHAYRLLTRIKIDVREMDLDLIKYIMTLNNNSNVNNYNEKSKNPLFNSLFKSKTNTDNAICCGMIGFITGAEKSNLYINPSKGNNGLYSNSYSSVEFWLRKGRLQCLIRNFLHNGFDFLEYFLILLFSDVNLNEEFIENAFHIYNPSQIQSLMKYIRAEKESIMIKANITSSLMFSASGYNKKYSELSNGVHLDVKGKEKCNENKYNGIYQDNESIQEGCNICMIF